MERFFLEVPLLGQGRQDFQETASQQRQARVTAVLQTGLSWDSCWEGVWQPELCLPQTENNSLVQMQPQCPQAALHPLLSWKPPVLMCSWCTFFLITCPAIPSALQDPPSALTPTPLFPEKPAWAGKRMQKGVVWCSMEWSLGWSIVNQVWLFSDFSHMHFLIHFIVIGLKEFTQNPRGPQAAQIIQVPGSKELLKFLP